MNNMIEVWVSDLIGPALDWAVATALDYKPVVETEDPHRGPYCVCQVPWPDGGYAEIGVPGGYTPSTDLSTAGARLQELFQIKCPGYFIAELNADQRARNLILACRTFVYTELGATVSVPTILVTPRIRPFLGVEPFESKSWTSVTSIIPLITITNMDSLFKPPTPGFVPELVFVPVSELSGHALDWAVMAIRGYKLVRIGYAGLRGDGWFDETPEQLDMPEWFAKATDNAVGAYWVHHGRREVLSAYWPGYTNEHDVPCSPSTDYAVGGPLLDTYHISFTEYAEGKVSASVNNYPWRGCWSRGRWKVGATRLIAACRAILADEIGHNVLAPAVLVKP